MTQVRILGRSIERARVIATTLLLGALLLMVGGVALEGPIGTILAAVGSTMATTALVSFLYDPFLKEVLAQEIFDRVGLRDSITRVGLEDVANARGLDLRDGIEGSRSIQVMPLDPFGWARETFPTVLASSVGTRTDVVILLPSPDPGAGRSTLANRLQLEEGDVERRLGELPEKLATAWDRAGVADGSTLTVVTHQHSVATGLLVCDRMAVIETGPSLIESSTEDTRLLQRFRRDGPFGDWAANQLVDVVEGGPRAIVRPVTAVDDLPHGGSSEAARPPRSPMLEDSETVQAPTDPTQGQDDNER